MVRSRRAFGHKQSLVPASHAGGQSPHPIGSRDGLWCVKALIKRLLRQWSLDIVRVRPRRRWPEDESRFAYQRTFNDFEIPPGSVVLDLGSGGYPFPLGTILADRFLEPTNHRTEPIVMDHRPFVLCDMEHLPFATKSIDFVYCSHVLEHAAEPLMVCREIVRVGKRGYIETPVLAKDMLFAWAQGMHRWHVIAIADKLCFFEYSQRQLEGVRTDAWRQAIFAQVDNPMQHMFYGNPDLFNVMFSWRDGFDCFVFRLDGRVERETLS